jgi:hypothetical protein
MSFSAPESGSGSARTHRSVRFRDAAAITIAALILRVVATTMVSLRVSPAAQLGGRSEMLAVAKSLATGHGFSSPFFAPSGPTAFLSPGYPLFLAAIFRLFGVDPTALMVVVALQVLFSTAAVWLTIRVADRQFGAGAAIVAGCICACFPSMILTPFFVWETCLSSLLLLLFFALLPEVRSKGQWAVAGGGVAAATLVNAALFPTLVLLSAWQAARRRQIPWIGILAFLLVYAPWPARNLARMHSLILFRSNFGYELWMGNRPGGNGEFDLNLDPESNTQQRAEFVSLGELGFMRQKSAAARAFIEAHPGTFLRLTGRRFVHFWTTDTDGSVVPGTALSLCALAGLLLVWRQRTSLRTYVVPMLLLPLPYYITHADARFRHTLDPFLAILAAYFFRSVLAGLRKSARMRPPIIEAADTNRPVTTP